MDGVNVGSFPVPVGHISDGLLLLGLASFLSGCGFKGKTNETIAKLMNIILMNKIVWIGFKVKFSIYFDLGRW